MPTSTPNGIVSGSTGGIAQRSSSTTVETDDVVGSHQNREQLVGRAQEDDERRQQRAQHGAGQNLAENVAAQQAHTGYRAISGGGATGSLGSSSSTGCSSRSSMMIEGATTQLSVV